MKKFRELIGPILTLLAGIAATIFIVKKAKTPVQIEQELVKKKAKIEEDYEIEKAEPLSKPPEVTIQEYYEELDQIKEVEIQEAVDEAMLAAERYKVP